MVSLEIPLDLQIEIMTRLPSKSLMRFKCLSKLWFSLIRSRYFTNLYLYLMVASPTRPPRLYMSLMDHFDCDSMEVCHNPGNSVLVSLSSSNNGESFDEELTIPGIGGRYMVVLRGLILYKVCRKACIYNPTTRQSLTLPAVKSNIFAQEGFEKDVDYFLGYDPVLDQYKVVCTVAIYSEDYETITSEHWVFVLEVGCFWKRIEFNQPHRPREIGPCINGVIYYSANTSMSSNIIVSFDVRAEEFCMIQAPDDVVHAYNVVVDLDLIEYGGRPAIFDYTHLSYSGFVELWVLEDGGKWSNKSLVLQPCQMHLVKNTVDNLVVEGTTRNGEVILAPLHLISYYYILYYDLRKNDLRKVNITRRIPDHEFIDRYIYLTLMDKSESIIHLEI